MTLTLRKPAVLVAVVGVMVCAVTMGQVQAVDGWKRTWVMESDELPTENTTGEVDFRKMAAVGNGHIATVLYSPVVYMNGLYNGPKGWTHRAAIQSAHDVRVDVPGVQATRHFALDMWTAVFTETIRTGELEVKLMTYAHQRLVQLLVTEVHATRIGSGGQEVNLTIGRSEINSTIDLNITEPATEQDLTNCPGTCLYTRGHTLITETEEAPVGEVHIYWTPIPTSLRLHPGQAQRRWIFITSYDQQHSKALQAFQMALTLVASTPDLLLETHKNAWAEKWTAGRIDVEGDDDLATVIHSSLYYILMSLPSRQPELPLEQFYGLSPGSLARGANWTDYQGHVFWDMETWMYPPIVVLFPDLARKMLSYRIYGGEGARVKAQQNGFEGWQFPWESAFTGYEMTPDVCVPCRDNEQHITGDVAFAARQYWAVTRDARWLQREGGLQLLLNTADFWASRAEWNADMGRYELNGVMPPDEYAREVNNSIYTNYIAKVNLLTANYVACLTGQPTDSAASERRRHVADQLYMVFNATGQYHPEYEGYDNPDTAYDQQQMVKQADAVMLGYPLAMDMDDTVRLNDLMLYMHQENPKGPAMTWSMFAINWLDLNFTHEAAFPFNRSYSLYRRPPFNVWWESASGITDTHRVGTSNFITGMGGFLQAVVFGYAGLRIELERLTFNPRLPPNTHSLRVVGIKYLQATVDLLIRETTVLVAVREVSDDFPLQLTLTSVGTSWRLEAGMEMVLPRSPFEVVSLHVTECPVTEGSSCPKAVRPNILSGMDPSLPNNTEVVLISQTGGHRCRDFLLCSQMVQHQMGQDDTIHFYIGDDNRLYQGAGDADGTGTMRVAVLGNYTDSGLSQEQEAMLRRVIKCGMETKISAIASDYKLRYNAQPAELCGTPPCAGNSLHCQLTTWKHWDSSQTEPSPTCSSTAGHQHLTPPTQSPPECPPMRTAPVNCQCPGSGASSPAVTASVVGLVSLAVLVKRQ